MHTPWWLELVLSAAALAGHVAIWAAAFNGLHAAPLSDRWVRLVGKVVFIGLAGAPAMLAAAWAGGRGLEPSPLRWMLARPLPAAYRGACWFALAAAASARAARALGPGAAGRLVANDTLVADAVERCGGPPVRGVVARVAAAVPGNQILQLHVQRKRLRPPRLPRELHGLKIAHLSDLHLTGRIGRAYFEMVVAETNAWDPDLIALTGDVADEPACLEWLEPLFRPLRGRSGAYFVLGNHDQRLPDPGALRRALGAAGLRDLGGRAVAVQVRGRPVLLAGNERPWFGPPPDVPPIRVPDSEEGERPFSILLAHTPDQIRWARRRGFDLMLAGHNHGGQIRLPALGPVVSPSWYGVKYASGVFFEAPTLLHVSRGVSSVEPVRWNCPPELALLTLESAEAPRLA